MDSIVFFSVLAAAAMHAGWNAVIKTGTDRFTTMTIMSGASAAVCVFLLPLAEWPSLTVWFWIAASTILHTGYKLFLIKTYSLGDLVQVYPLARGTAPLIVAVVSLLFLTGEVTPSVFAGIVVLVAGIWLMALRGGQNLRRINRSAVLAALGTSGFIAGYTLVDGVGARQAASAASFMIYLAIMEGVAIGSVYLATRGVSGLRTAGPAWKGGCIGGVLSLSAYWIVVWAMTQAPIAAVAALRETSVLFAVAIATFVMKEKLTAWRVAAALLITSGVGVLRL